MDEFYWWNTCTRRIGNWSIARYHAHYRPQCGYEPQVQSMVSTGGILVEFVSSPQLGTVLSLVHSVGLRWKTFFCRQVVSLIFEAF